MRDNRLYKAHELLQRMEALRFRVVSIANLTNTYVTDAYEKQLFDELNEVDTLIQKALECSRIADPCQQSAE